MDLPSPLGTPLHLAATYGQDGTMKILLEHHADVRHRFSVHTGLFKRRRKIGVVKTLKNVYIPLTLSCTGMGIMWLLLLW